MYSELLHVGRKHESDLFIRFEDRELCCLYTSVPLTFEEVELLILIDALPWFDHDYEERQHQKI